MISKLRIDVSAAGMGEVYVDGKPIGGSLAGLNIRIRGGKLTKVALFMAADIEAEINGIITRATLDGRVTKEQSATPL